MKTQNEEKDTVQPELEPTVNRKLHKTIKGIGKNKMGYITYWVNPLTKSIRITSKNVLSFSSESMRKITTFIPDFRDYISSVYIDGDFENIMDGAFKECSFKKIEMPTIRSIGASAFEDCADLKSVVVGNKIYDIGANAFWGCISLRKVALPSWRNLNIDPKAFPHWIKIKSL